MRQVPTIRPQHFFPLLLGRGKLARHLHHYFHLINFEHKHFDETLRSDELKSPELDRKLLATNAIWIMVSDQAIEPVLQKIKKRLIELGADLNEYIFIHSSAATRVEGMCTFHPLMTFANELYSREQYELIPFATFSGETKSALTFPLPNPHFVVPNEKREFYHACAVMMSNLPILLWSKVANDFENKIPAADARVFHPILKQTLQNFITHGAEALTGPIARKDQITIQKNLAAIEGSPLHAIYQNFTLKENQP